MQRTDEPSGAQMNADTTTHTVPLSGLDPVPVTVTSYGAGRPYLVLHGGAGPQSVTGFAELLAEHKGRRVLVPVHPGFGGTPRPDSLSSIGQLAQLYANLLDGLALDEVTVIGNSVGGWITAELALLGSPRVRDIVLIDAVGLAVPGHPVADFFALTMEEVFARTFHDPAPFRIDPSTMTPAARAVAGGNRTALEAYAGTSMTDPTLSGRLSGLTVSTLILWGESDQIADPDYGRAYAAAIPGSRFQLLHDTGHAPQLETPTQVLAALEKAL
jgi:pimeloyl-ACP methyl ester carboxylesterase